MVPGVIKISFSYKTASVTSSDFFPSGIFAQTNKPVEFLS